MHTRQRNSHGVCALALDHHVYDQLSGTWVNRKSQPQPFIKLTVQAVPEDLHQSINQPFITYCSINAGLDTTQLVKLVKITITK